MSGGIDRPAASCEAIADAPTSVITNSDVPTACGTPIVAKATSAGTMRKPPPTPNTPDRSPTTSPTSTRSTTHRAVIRSRPLESRLQVGPTPAQNTDAGIRSLVSAAFRHIRTAITSIRQANENRSRRGGMRLPSQLPTGAVSIPAPANRRPLDTSTWPYRHRSTAPTRAVTATVTSEMLTAVVGSTPTTKTSSGTAKIAPPPPVSPSESPTTAPAAIDWNTTHAGGSAARLRSMAAGRGSMKGFQDADEGSDRQACVGSFAATQAL